MANKKADALSDLKLKKLKQPTSKKWVRDGNGLALCLTPAVKGDWRHWYFVYTSPETSKRRYYPIGSYPDTSLADARTEATQLLADVKKGIDPLAQERRESEKRREDDEQKLLAIEAAARVLSVGELCTEYIDKYAKKFKRSWQEDERILNREVIPLWGKRKAQDIKKRDIILLLEDIVERGSPGMANNTFKIIRKMLNYAVEKDILPFSAATGVKLPAPLNARERVLSQDEVKLLWDSLDTASISPDIRCVIKLILLTAQRPGEVIGMHTSEIDGSWWTIPSERAKNGKAHRVFLTTTAKDIVELSIARIKAIREIPTESTYKGYIFPCPHHKKVKSIDRHAVSRAIAKNLSWTMTDDKGNILYTKDGKAATENRLGVDPFTPHDLRRSSATFMAQAGEMDEVIDAVLNHAKQGVIKVYNQYRYDDEKQMALEELEFRLTCIISGEEYRTPKQREADKIPTDGKKDNVIDISQGRRKAA